MARRVDPLSESKVETARPMANIYRIFDSGGLILFVTPGGGKWWRFKYRFEGKQKMLALGTYPEVSLDDARCGRDAAHELLLEGIAPSAVRKEEKARGKAEQLERERTPSVRITFDGKIEVWKGGNMMRLTRDEARFVGDQLINIVR